MKKTLIIAVSAVIILAFFVPVPKTYADGTKSYNAVAYKIVKWNRPYYKNLLFTQKTVYKFPHSLKSVDELWSGMELDPDVSTLTGTVEFSVGEKESGPVTEDVMVSIKSTSECEKFILQVKEAVVVNEIFGRYTFKTDAYDNLPDYEITIGSHRFLYESSSGIVTDTVIKKVNEEQSFMISKADRETINALIKKYAGTDRKTSAPETTEESTAAIESNPPVRDYCYDKPDPNDSIHYVRRSWSSSADYPQVVFIKNRAQYDALISDERENYGGNDGVFDKKYTDKFFEDRALVIIFTSESSGSNYYSGVQINANSNEICVNRYSPEVRTCDMASWAIVCEVSAADQILKQDNTKTTVIFTE
ncbi:MAG: hypothetical protein K6B52_06170 [Clostridiales bacterium]|nr:hypothetical protein [Clostridiales bacterium]